MRLKVKLTIQAEVFNGTILQQSFVVEYVVEKNMCPDCNRANANPNSWIACAQVGVCALTLLTRCRVATIILGTLWVLISFIRSARVRRACRKRVVPFLEACFMCMEGTH